MFMTSEYTNPFFTNDSIDNSSPIDTEDKSPVKTNTNSIAEKGFTFLTKKAKKWTRLEDIQLNELVEQYGEKWEEIGPFYPERSIIEIKHRYMTKFNPNLNKDKFTKEEDEKIIELQAIHGNKWTSIAKNFNNRAPNMIKNRYYSKLKHQLEKEAREIQKREQEEISKKEASMTTTSIKDPMERLYENIFFNSSQSGNNEFNENHNHFNIEFDYEESVEVADKGLIEKIDTLLSVVQKMRAKLKEHENVIIREEREEPMNFLLMDDMFQEKFSFV